MPQWCDALVFPLRWSPLMEKCNKGQAYFPNDIAKGDDGLYRIMMVSYDPAILTPAFMEEFAFLGVMRVRVAKVLTAKRDDVQWEILN